MQSADTLSARYESFVRFVVALAGILGVLFVVSCGQGETASFLPNEIKDIQMGMSWEQIQPGIKDSGTYARSELKRPGRFKITWPLTYSHRYKRIEFEFTEKGRLYQARFVLLDELRWKSKSLKKKFFKRFGISWLDPGKMRIRDKDVIVYVPEKKSPNFFDMTDVRTGEKWFEIFDRSVSVIDRQKPKQAQKKEGTTGKDPTEPPESTMKTGAAGPLSKTKPE